MNEAMRLSDCGATKYVFDDECFSESVTVSSIVVEMVSDHCAESVGVIIRVGV